MLAGLTAMAVVTAVTCYALFAEFVRAPRASIYPASHDGRPQMIR